MMSFLRQRKSPRLKEYNYAQSNAYFVTICTHNRVYLFGEIENNNMVLNSLGRLLETEIASQLSNREAFDLNSYVIMPNHLHMIIIIGDVPQTDSGTLTLGQIIRGFKARATYMARTQQLMPSDTFQLWQSRYHDHIIRDEKAFQNIRTYIAENPMRWATDTFFHQNDLV